MTPVLYVGARTFNQIKNFRNVECHDFLLNANNIQNLIHHKSSELFVIISFCMCQLVIFVIVISLDFCVLIPVIMKELDERARICVDLVNGLKRDQALKYWKIISRKSNLASPFLSYSWVNAWINTLAEVPLVALLRKDNEEIGMCFLGVQKHSYFGLKIRTAFLNQVGNEKTDQIWIEYNGVICLSGFRDLFFRELFKELARNGIDRLIISMTEKEISQTILKQSQLFAKHISTIGFVAHLSKSKDVLSSHFISKNTRNQIKRSNKKIEDLYGPLTIRKGVTFQEKIEIFEKLATMHRIQWGHTREGSGFNNSYFTQHHMTLLEESDFFELVEVKGGETVLGCAINFLFDKTVYFYCSGINHQISTKHIKPGYSMHSILMEFYRKQGFERYDFMGGDAQYKKSLSDTQVDFISISAPLATQKGRLISLYYRLKNLISVK